MNKFLKLIAVILIIAGSFCGLLFLCISITTLIHSEQIINSMEEQSHYYFSSLERQEMKFNMIKWDLLMLVLGIGSVALGIFIFVKTKHGGYATFKKF